MDIDDFRQNTAEIVATLPEMQFSQSESRPHMSESTSEGMELTNKQHLIYQEKFEINKKKRSGKMLFGSILVCILVAGVVAAIVILIQPYKEKPKPFYGCRRTGDDIVTFQGNLTVYCQISLGNVSKDEDTLVIKFKSNEPMPKIEGNDVKVPMDQLNVSTSNFEDWEVGMEKTKDSKADDMVWAFSLTRKNLSCESGGMYTFAVVHDNKQTVQFQVPFAISNEASQVDMSIIRNNPNSTEFQIQCAVSSGCASQSIYLEGSRGNRKYAVNDIQFKCDYRFNPSGGATTSCRGAVTSQILKSFETIICRPGDLISGSSFDIENKEGIIYSSALCTSDDCQPKCSTNKNAKYMDDTSCRAYHVCNDDNTFTTKACDNGMAFSNSTCECSIKEDELTGCSDGKWIVPLADLTKCMS